MKNTFLYSLLFFLMTLWGCGGCEQKKLPSLKETYHFNDKKPFGGFIAFNMLSEFSGIQPLHIASSPLNEELIKIRNTKKVSNSLYFLLSKNLLLSNQEVRLLLKYAADGNDLFISADYIPPALLKALHIRVNRRLEANMEAGGTMQETFVRPIVEDHQQSFFSYYYFPFYNSIQYEKRTGIALGFNQNLEANFVRIRHGEGSVFVHVAPRALSNYFLLSGQNLDYLHYVLSVISKGRDYIFWDEYYKLPPEDRRAKADQKENFSALRVFKKHPSLMWAFGMVIAGIVLYVLFNIKRKQRSVPQIMPPANATVAFTEIIGRLYLQHKDNKNIAEKQITYFYEKIRKHYFIHTSVIDKAFLKTLSGKSGLPEEMVNDLFALIGRISKAGEVTDEELLTLNNKITTFNKKRK